MQNCKPFLLLEVSVRLLVFIGIKVLEADGCQCYHGGMERGMRIGKVPSSQSSLSFPTLNSFL